jgi:hypothetical protein
MKDNHQVKLKLIALSLALPILLSGCATQMVHDRHGTVHETKWKHVVNYEKNSSGDYVVCAFGSLAQQGLGYYQIQISKSAIPMFKSYGNRKIIFPYSDQFTKLTSPPTTVKKDSMPSLPTPVVGEKREENCIIFPGWDNGIDVVIYCPSPTTYDTKGKILLPLAVISDVVTFPVQCVLAGFSFLEQ